jgi:hypothetical protein
MSYLHTLDTVATAVVVCRLDSVTPPLSGLRWTDESPPKQDRHPASVTVQISFVLIASRFAEDKIFCAFYQFKRAETFGAGGEWLNIEALGAGGNAPAASLAANGKTFMPGCFFQVANGAVRLPKMRQDSGGFEFEFTKTHGLCSEYAVVCRMVCG